MTFKQYQIKNSHQKRKFVLNLNADYFLSEYSLFDKIFKSCSPSSKSFVFIFDDRLVFSLAVLLLLLKL